MPIDVDANGVMRQTGGMGIVFRNPNTGQESVAQIHTNPNVVEGEAYKEGDKYVEVSIEAFGELMALVGFFPVDPKSNSVVIPDHLLRDANEEYADEVDGTDE